MECLRSAAKELENNDVRVLGVSMDPVPKQRYFADRFGITFPLLCNTSGSICDALNVPHPNNKPARYSFLFYKKKLIWADQRVSPKYQDKHVFEGIEEHKAAMAAPAS